MFRAAILIFQLLTATTQSKVPGKDVFVDYIISADKLLLINALYDMLINEFVLKEYVDDELKKTINNGCTRTFQSTGAVKTRYSLIGEFLDKNLDGIALAYNLQQLGNERGEKVVDYPVLINIAYYFYLFRMLIECNALPVDKNKRVSFDTLYSHVYSLIPNVKIDLESKQVANTIERMLETITTFIKKYWKMNRSKPKRLSSEEYHAIIKICNDLYFKDDVEILLHRMHSNGKITSDVYFEIRSFYEVLSSVISMISNYINIFRNLRTDDLSKEGRSDSEDDPIKTGWKHVNDYLFRVPRFIRSLCFLALGEGNTNKFLNMMAFKDQEVALKNASLKSNSSISSSLANPLLEMLLTTSSLDVKNANIEIDIDKINGCKLKVDDSLKTALSDEVDDEDRRGDPDNIKHDKSIQISPWIIWSIVILIFAVIVGGILGCMYLMND